MADDSAAPRLESHTQPRFGNLTADERLAFDKFKERCRTEGLLEETASGNDDLMTGICDDGTLLRFLRARRFNVQNALYQYQTTRTWRDNNRILELYEHIEAEDYEETRKLYTHWTGRRDKHGLPCCWFEIKQLTPDVMSAYNASCASSKPLPAPEGKGVKAESTAMLRLFCTYDNLVRFVMPLCSAVPGRPNPETPVTGTNCIIDISGVGLLQFWRLRAHMQAASTLATAHYPETLGRTYVIGAPAFFPTIWGWIKTWFDQNTVSKIVIVPAGKEFSALCESYDPVDIPRKYGGEFEFDFGMPPNLDPEIRNMLEWLPSESGEKYIDFPMGPMRWRSSDDGKRTAVVVGRVNGKERKSEVMKLAGGVFS